MLKIRSLGRAAPRAEPPDAGPTIAPLLAINDVCHILGIDRRTFERMRATPGRVPEPSMFVGTRSPRWTVSTILGWIGEGHRG